MNDRSYTKSSQGPEIRPHPTWWASDRTGWLYFLREFTGVLIAFYMLTFIVAWWQEPGGLFVGERWFKVVSAIGLVGAVFHSLTWFAVSVKVTPFDLPKWLERVGLLAMILVWSAISYGLWTFLYETTNNYLLYAD
jgi:fumarate reductase subunit C